MKTVIVSLLVAVLLLQVINVRCEEEKRSFLGYKLLRIYPRTNEHVKYILELEHKDNNVYFLLVY